MKITRDLKSIIEDPVEGVFCELIDESNLFEWKIWFEGPGESPFQGIAKLISSLFNKFQRAYLKQS